MENVNTLQYFLDLKEAKVPEEQAEAQLIALENMLQGLATKSELLAMKNELLDKIDTRLDKAVNNLKWFVVYVVAGTFAVSFIL